MPKCHRSSDMPIGDGPGGVRAEIAHISQYEDWIFGGSGGPRARDHRILRWLAWWRLARRVPRRIWARLLRRKTFLPRRILPIRRRMALLRRWIQSLVVAAHPRP